VTNYARQSIILGLTVTLLVVGIELFGALDTLERETIDVRFAHARWRAEPMSDQIRFVDIDDGALESIGGWPWPRSKLADALDELRRAGARTVALDVLLEDAKDPDDDARLGSALASIPCVLPVRVGDPVLFHPVWQTTRGARELARLLDELSRDIRLRDSEAIEKAGLTGARDDRFLDRPLEFKKAAAALALHRLRDEVGDEMTYEAFVQAVAPGVGDHVGEFPESGLLRRTWEQDQAWRAVKPFLSPPPGQGAHRDRAPWSTFARQAAAVGFVNVNFQRDPDGELRTVPPFEPGPGGSVPQFGLAAAALHLGLETPGARLEGDRVVAGPVELPLAEGRMRLAWPTTRTDWSGVLRQGDSDRMTAGRISIAAVISLAAERPKLDRNKDLLMELALAILNRDALPPDGLSEAFLDEVDSEVRFQLASVREVLDRGEQLTEQESQEIARFEQWPILKDAIVRGETEVAEAEARLKAEVRDRLVFIGMTGTGTAADVVQTPLGAKTPGVVAHAVVAEMALSGRRMRPAPAWTGWGLALLLGLLCTSLAARLTPAVSTALVLTVLAGYVALAGWWVFGATGGVFPMVAPVSAGAGSWIACTALGAALFQRDRRRITRRFKTRVSAQLVDYLIENPNAVSMIGEQREVTVMFLDIAGFTAITESLDGPVVVGALNRCMSELTRSITYHEGYVNKFLGDGLMAFWSPFREDPEQAVRACTCALECQEAVRRLNRSEGFAQLPPISVRVGIATGRVIVGDCGAPPQLNDYTVIGNDVNLASRLESANKQFGTGILITQRTREQLGPTEFQTRPMGRIIVVGQTIPVEVYELLPADADRILIKLNAEAVKAFEVGDYDASATAWERMTRECGPSRLAEFYLRAIAEHDLVVDGAVRLEEK
jgi:class 3 adenylate cyclase